MPMQTTSKFILLPLLLGAALFFILFSQAFRFHNPEYLDHKYMGYIKVKKPTHHFIIRLHNAQNDFFCTGFVIDDNYAVTAGHCITSSFNQFMIRTDDINIWNVKNEPTGIIAKPAAMNPRMDYALIRGDFSEFDRVEIVTGGFAFMPGHPLISCGFPMGQKRLFCSQVSFLGTQGFAFAGTGLLYPGMSGGPVIDLLSNRVIGVNSYVSGSIMAFYPMIGMLSAFGVEP